jgi:para-nitrobenzyl esterase
MEAIARTRQGSVEGASHKKAWAYRGIPFARPPIDGLRFAAPEPPEPWTGVRSAKDFGPSAPQIGPVNRFIRTMIAAAGSTQSQDCLYLNVFTPAPDRARRPVLVWLHGGAFILGSGSTGLYDGWRLARRGDVVVVTLNYRLGALGYLSWRSLCGEAERPAENLGVLDQIAALEWVRDNIEEFGGDPENVTLFGESAGAMSVGVLLGTPRARGLFHKAILQSGAAHNAWYPRDADNVAQQFAKALGVERTTPDAMRGLSVREIMRAQAITSARIGLTEGVLAWQPTVDGDLLPEHPLTAIDQGHAAHVPTLIGTNRDECKLFMMGNSRVQGLDEETLAQRLAEMLANAGPGKERVTEAYARVKGRFGGEPSERWAAFWSDNIFHYPAVRLADSLSDSQPQTYSYIFNWSPPMTVRYPGACHGIELPFVFGSIRSPVMRATLGALSSAQRLCDRVQDAWVAFARGGSPEHESLPDWPAYSRSCRNTMGLGSECFLQEDPHGRAREFWHPLLKDGHLSMRSSARIYSRTSTPHLRPVPSSQLDVSEDAS